MRTYVVSVARNDIKLYLGLKQNGNSPREYPSYQKGINAGNVKVPSVIMKLITKQWRRRFESLKAQIEFYRKLKPTTHYLEITVRVTE